RFLPGEADDRRNRRVDPTKFVLLAKILILRAPNYCNRSAEATHSRIGFEKFSADLQRVGRKQIVSTRIMVRVGGLGRYESITTFVRHDSDGMPPRLKIRAVDILYDARHSEVVDAARRFVFRLPFQHCIRYFGS